MPIVHRARILSKRQLNFATHIVVYSPTNGKRMRQATRSGRNDFYPRGSESEIFSRGKESICLCGKEQEKVNILF